MRSLPLILLVCACLCFGVGCAVEKPQDCQPCLDQCPQDCLDCPPSCEPGPDGSCLYRTQLASEDGQQFASPERNGTPPAETRSGEGGMAATDCWRCPPVELRRPYRIQVRPAMLKPNPADEVKTGSFACERCGRSTVGKEWHVTSTDTGMSVMYMCEKCWQSTGITERKRVLEKHLKRHGVPPEQAFYMRAAISEAR